MPRCAFLTLSDPTGYCIDDQLAAEPLRELGWQMQMVPWDRPDIAWEDYALVVIRSTWDWYRAPGAFLGVLEDVVRRGVRLENSLALVRWNLDKTYLRELAGRGVPTVPTIFRDRLGPGELDEVLETLGTRDAVLKPVIGANAEGAHRIAACDPAEVEAYFGARALMAQPFVRAVVDEGEASLFFFDGACSHAVRKVPRAGDFRVQEEHGGAITAMVPDDALRAAAQRVVAALPEVPLYARVDLVRGNDGEWWLMELELVEPSLYLRMDPKAPQRLARAVAARASA